MAEQVDEKIAYADAYKDGVASYPTVTQNPHPSGTMARLGWEAGWNFRHLLSKREAEEPEPKMPTLTGSIYLASLVEDRKSTTGYRKVNIPVTMLQPIMAGCVCPAGAEATCKGLSCPRRGL